jgi:hypothetical protein
MANRGTITTDRAARFAVVVLLAGMLAATLVSAPVARAAGGNGLREAANEYRTKGRLAPVAGTPLLDSIATARAADMARKVKLEHDMAYVKSRLVNAGVCWTAYGEIIAWSRGAAYSYDGTVKQWMNSDLHREIVMGSQFNAAGGAWDDAADGGHYSVMVFVALCGADKPAVPYGATPFTDISGSAFRNDIEWLYQSGITAGCDADSFCPTAGVTRAQMASFLDRALDLPPTSRDFFRDDNGLVHEDAINRAAAAGITAGCGASSFCPSGGVTREQMASFLVRAGELHAGAGLDLFEDDNRSAHEFDIDRLAYGGITSGCAERRYCPSGTVTREQMAAFLRRSFG